jgi:IclR family acetate operon transcriptional repressor
MKPADLPPGQRQGIPREYEVAVLGKALDLLEALAEGEELGLSELSRHTNVNKSSAFRILTTLENRGYVLRLGRHRTYAPGPKLIAVSARFLSGLKLVTFARPVMEGVYAEFRETVNLGVLNDRGVLYIDILESRQGLRMAARVGTVDPLHSTALGKAILSCLPRDEIKRLMDRYEWERRTRRTITTVEVFERELERIRQRGYAIDDEENEAGARCVGVPIRGRDSRPIAALSVSGPASRLSQSILGRIGKRLRTAAQKIERQMGREVLNGGSLGLAPR